MTPPLITILGPTASGKTRLAAALAADIGGEIISGDSRQVYRRMDLGTGKDLLDYTVSHPNGTTTAVPYHLIDIAEPGTKYNLFEYQRDFTAAYNDIINRHARPILCGGTGLYIEAVLRGYSLAPVPENTALRQQLENKTLPELTALLADLKQQHGTAMHNTTDIDTAKRAIRAIEIELATPQAPTDNMQRPSCIIGLHIDRDTRRQRITERLHARLNSGMIAEVQQLLNDGISPNDLIYYGLEYKYLTLHAIGQLSYSAMAQQLETAIHQFAKRQMTWFRGMERRGLHIHWIDALRPVADNVAEIKAII